MLAILIEIVLARCSITIPTDLVANDRHKLFLQLEAESIVGKPLAAASD